MHTVNVPAPTVTKEELTERILQAYKSTNCKPRRYAYISQYTDELGRHCACPMAALALASGMSLRHLIKNDAASPHPVLQFAFREFGYAAASGFIDGFDSNYANMMRHAVDDPETYEKFYAIGSSVRCRLRQEYPDFD